MNDIKKLLQVTCPGCNHQQRLVPEGFPDELVQKLNDNAGDGGNITVCMECAMPLHFNGEKWVILPGAMLGKLPSDAIKSMSRVMMQIMQRTGNMKHAELVLLLEMAMMVKSFEPKDGNTKAVIVTTGKPEEADHSRN